MKQVAALPFRRDGAGGVDVMLVTSRDSKRWIIPKGWAVKGVKPHHCAAREAYEEAGLSGRVSKSAVGEFEYVKRLGGVAAAPCRVLVFPLETKTEKRKWPEMHERKRAWFPAEIAAELVSEPGLVSILLSFARPPERRLRTSRRSKHDRDLLPLARPFRDRPL